MQDLDAVYRATSYVVDDGDVRFTIRLDKHNPEFLRFLKCTGMSTWAFLTAHNPLSQPLSEPENEARQAELSKLLENDGYAYLKGKGIGDDPSWIPEPSLFVANINRTDAVEFGKRFDQNAILWGKSDAVAELIWCV